MHKRQRCVYVMCMFYSFLVLSLTSPSISFSRSVNQNGKKKTLTLTRQCCHGYGRPRNADFNTPCEKIEIKDIEATAADMGAKQFIESAKSAGELGAMLASGSGKHVTLFVPNDAAYLEYRGQHQQENVSRVISFSLFLSH